MKEQNWLALALAFGSALWATQEATAYSSNFASWYAVADAPWRIQPNVELMPVSIVVKTSSEFGRTEFLNLTSISVFDANNNGTQLLLYDGNGNLLSTFLNGVLPAFIQQRTWMTTVYVKRSELKLDNTLGIYSFTVILSGQSRIGTLSGNGSIINGTLATLWNNVEEHYPLSVHYGNGIPSIPGYICGDTHFHTIYTDNYAEVGNTINASAEAAQLIGLDWFAVTDHSFDLDSQNPPELGKWGNLKQECAAVNGKGGVRCLVGEEISAENSAGKYVHLLGYRMENYTEAIYGDGDSFGEKNCIPDEHGTFNQTCTLPLYLLLSSLKQSGAFSYYAHPLEFRQSSPTNNSSDLFLISGRLGPIYARLAGINKSAADMWIASMPYTFLNDGELNIGDYVSEDYTLPNYAGIQLWNGRTTENVKSRDLVLEKWRTLLTENLSRHINAIGGTDSHGDFNILRRRIITGESSDNTSSFGRVRTCCRAANNPSSIYDALQNGRCYMTDGPAVTLTADGVGMGDTLNIPNGRTPTVVLTWNTTAEFGNVSSITVFKGKKRELDALPVEEIVWQEYQNIPLQGSKVLPFSLSTNESYYLRVVLVGGGGFVAFSNPVWVNVSVAPFFEAVDLELTAQARGTYAIPEGYNPEDGNVNPGEEVDFTLKIENTGAKSGGDVSVEVWTAGPCVRKTLAQYQHIGAITAGDYEYVDVNHVDVYNLTNCKVGDGEKAQYIKLNVTIDDWAVDEHKNKILEIPVHPPTWIEFDTIEDRPPTNSSQPYFIGLKLPSSVTKARLFYRCQDTSVDDLHRTGWVDLSNYCVGSCPYNWKTPANFLLSEECEGKKVYWRIRTYDSWWGYQWSPYDDPGGGYKIGDDDVSPPNITVLSFGDADAGGNFIIAATFNDTKGIQETQDLPRVLYRWNASDVSQSKFDGIEKLAKAGGLWTAAIEAPEAHEGEHLYVRVQAADADNTPEYALSAVSDAGAVLMKPPTTPEIIGGFVDGYNVTLVWMPSSDGSGISAYEIEEYAKNKTTYASQIPLLQTQNKSLGNVTYRVRAQDAKGNWGVWSQNKTIEIKDLRVKEFVIQFNTTGWKYISIPLIPLNTSFKPFGDSFFKSLHTGNATDFGPGFDGSYDFTIGPIADSSATLASFNPTVPSWISQGFNKVSEKTGFSLWVNKPSTMKVLGYEPTTTVINFSAAGWYWIGYPGKYARPIKPFRDSVLSSLHDGNATNFGPDFDGAYDIIQWQKDDCGVGPNCSVTFDPKKPPQETQNLTELTPGRGYIIHVTRPSAFIVDYNKQYVAQSACLGSSPPAAGDWRINVNTVCEDPSIPVFGKLVLNNVLSLDYGTLVFTSTQDGLIEDYAPPVPLKDPGAGGIGLF
ncbi:Uncharacterised protein [uncultured archaeon]|nr:Uncharacterised protein [uncultured archaeon]